MVQALSKEAQASAAAATALDVSDAAADKAADGEDAIGACAIDVEAATFGSLLVANRDGHKLECGAHVRCEDTPFIAARLKKCTAENTTRSNARPPL